MAEQDNAVYEEVRTMRDAELVDFIRDTVARLNALGDRLETYASETEPIEVGFDTGDAHEHQPQA